MAQFVRTGGARAELHAVRRRELPAETFQEGTLGGPLREPATFHDCLADFRDAARDATGAETRTAALVVTDRWLRLTFADLEDVPRNAQQREEALRFKLRRQVPFRVEELRVRGARTGGRGGSSRRFMIAFGIEHVLAQLEDSFRRVGIHIGMVTNGSLAAAHAMREAGGAANAFLLLLAQHDGYSLLAHTPDGPALYRYKHMDPALPPDVASQLAVRDLLLTRSFIEERSVFGNGLPGKVEMLAPRELRPEWQERIDRGLGLRARLPEDQSSSRVGSAGLALEQALPMLGASLTVRM